MMQNTEDLREIEDRCKRIIDVLEGSGGLVNNSTAMSAVERFRQ